MFGFQDALGQTNLSVLPSRRWVVLLGLACVVAIGASGYLAYVALTSSKIAGCGGGRLFNCGHVISSRWSLWMGIPVSLLAVGLYTGLAASMFVGASSRFGSLTRHVGWVFVSILAISAGMAAIWFISLQVFVLQHLCIWCLVAHACGLVAATTILVTRPFGTTGLRTAGSLAAVGVLVLVTGQLLSRPPATFRVETWDEPAVAPEVFEFDAPDVEPAASPTDPATNAGVDPSANFLPNSAVAIAAIFRPASLLTLQVDQTKTADATQAAKDPQKTDERRLVSINGGTIRLDVAQWPIAGSQQAKYIFVEMLDYSCPHCRKTHAAIKSASEILAGDMAVVILPIPLNAGCNSGIQVTDPKFMESCEIAKLAVAVWRLDPARFTDFHNWMFATEPAPVYATAKAHAESLVDATRLNAELASAVPGQYIDKTVELYKRAGSGNVPKLIFPTTSVVGEFTSGAALVDIIKKQIQ